MPVKKRKTKKINPEKVVVSLDPGIEFGYAVWNAGSFEKLVPPMHVGVVSSARRSWDARANHVCDKFLTTLSDLQVQICGVVYEMPQYMESKKGRTSDRSGSVIKLSIMAGRLVQAMVQTRMYDPVLVTPVAPAVWKGNMSKKQVATRIRKKCREVDLKRVGASHNTSHDWDAIGIGLWAKGYF